MTDIVLNPITSGYNVSRINANFDAIEDTINGELLHTEGGNNTMNQDLDMNGHAILNLGVNPDAPGSTITLEYADEHYYNVDGDMLTGTMNVNGQTITGLKAPESPTEAVRKQELDEETSARVAADINLQTQISGGAPLEASAFSPISWHDQTIDNSLEIPANKNAWSFGPTMTISPGQVVVIGMDSFWTIASGEVVV